MDIVSLGFLFLIILGGGASAWLADWLGWRIGKKRHSLFGMRPKHFARLVVTIAGALIPLATISLLAASSEEIRIWIAQGRRAAQEFPSVVKQRDEAQKELDAIRREAETLRIERARGTQTLAVQDRALKEQERRLQEQRQKLSVQSARLAKLGPRIVELTRRVNLRQEQVSRLTLANQRVQISLQKTTEKLAASSKKLSDSLGELKVVQGETKVANAQRKVALNINQEIQARNVELQNRNIELSRSVEDLTSRIDDLNEEITSLSSARNEARKETEAAQTERDLLRGDVERLDRERARLGEALQLYKGEFRQIRGQPLTFRTGDELARIVAPAGLSVSDARSIVESLLRQARLEAERRGAQPNPNVNPPMRAADLIEGELDGKPIGPGEQIERLATRLAGSERDTLVVASSIFNIFGNEAVALDLTAFPDPLVFRAGEVVAEGRLDSRRGDAAVYTQINEFLSTRVQDRALAVNMVPLRTGGEESFGQIEPEQILQVIRVARGEERVYRLQAIAVGDIRAGDRLKIELRLK